MYQEVLVTQRNWMATFLGWALQGRWKELGGSVHVLRRVDNFLGRHFSVDSEVRLPLSDPQCFIFSSVDGMAMDSFSGIGLIDSLSRTTRPSLTAGPA